MPDNAKSEPDPKAPVTDDEVEGHGIEEDDVADGAASFTATGCCME